MILHYWPSIVSNKWDNLSGCFLPDRDSNGDLVKYKLTYIDDGKCTWLPFGLKLTYAQTFVFTFTFITSIFVFSLNMIFWFCYRFVLLQKYKVEPDRPWPWEEDKVAWDRIFYRGVFRVTFNNTFTSLFCSLLLCYLWDWQNPWSFDKADIPDSYTLAGHMLFCSFSEDLFEHFSHRLMHRWTFLYQWVHKHHHEHVMPIALSAQNAHPVEFIINNFYPSMSGMLFLASRSHYSELILWGIFRIWDAHEGHSGYEFPWSFFRLLPFGAEHDYHYFHHTRNVGNYSSFMSIWDTVLNSNNEYYEEKY